MKLAGISTACGRRWGAALLCALAFVILGCADAPPAEVSSGTDGVTTASAPPSSIPTTTAAPTTAAPTTSTQSRPERPTAPGFEGVTLSGEEVSLRSFVGKPLVLFFWSSG